MSRCIEKTQAYRPMAASCETRPIRQRRVVWTWIETEPFRQGRFQVKILPQSRIHAAVDLWCSSYPELYGSPHEFILDPEAYPRMVTLAETWEQDAAGKVYCMPVVEELSSGNIVSATMLTKFEKNLQVEFTFAATHPDYRMKDLTDRLRRVTRQIAENSGAEYFTTFCETWHDITQKWCINGGWKIAGIFPGNFIRWQSGDREYRGCTVHFYRFAGDGEKYATRPDEWHLAPEARAVWETLEKVNQGRRS